MFIYFKQHILTYVYLKYTGGFHIDFAGHDSLIIRKLILLGLQDFKRYNCLFTWC